MEVRYIGKNDFMTGKIYVVLSIEDDDYRIVDESGEDYPYPIDSFEIVGGSESDVEANAPIFEIHPYDDEEPPGAALYKEACNLIDAARKGNVKGYQEGMKFLLDAAEIGNIGAMNCIGMLYYRGYGVKQDYTQALKWFRNPVPVSTSPFSTFQPISKGSTTDGEKIP